MYALYALSPIADVCKCDFNEQVLGKGAFGIVYAAQEKQGTETFACKSIAKAKLVSEASLALSCTTKPPNQLHLT